ncbi:MAG TPA: DUF1002 domain-containing protein [Sporolactobacillaceae bacterium]|nr:DUF1002 domain-containing protein [Sporolactobacillaceae bacterium]
MKKVMFYVMLLCVFFIVPLEAFADATPGDVIVTLGQDLTASQRASILNEMGVDPNSVQIVTVTNQEEHHYLDAYIPRAEIGTKAISSAKITIGEPNSGIQVTTHNIDYVTENMYINALTTAGVKDAKVYVTAPFPVSGTGALTGIIKAYEKASGSAINDNQKQVANQEMATTTDLAKESGIGQDKAAKLMTTIKQNMAANMPKTDSEMANLIRKSADQTGVTLSEADVQKLVDLFDKIKNLNINWSSVNQQLKQAINQLNTSVTPQEKQSFLNVISAIFHALVNFFHSIVNNK